MICWFLKYFQNPNYFEVGPLSKVVDLFKLYTFEFGHILIRGIVWKKILLYTELLELSQMYEQVLIFFLLLPLSVSLQRRPPPITGIFPRRQLHLRRSSCATLSHPIYNNINRAIIYAPRSSHAYIQQIIKISQHMSRIKAYKL
jgi:hypothetical protein